MYASFRGVAGFILSIVVVLSSGALRSQEQLVVVDEENTPIPFAYVTFSATDTNTVQQATAFGTLELPGFRPDTVTASALGFAEEKMAWKKLRVGDYRIVLRVRDELLEVATVVGRRDESLSELNQQVGVISRRAMERAQAMTTADALAELGGVYVQKSQFGGGSPVLRGFEANRVLLVVDGVRMNNAIYRSGHLQNAITVDPMALDRMELIYGAGALAYGSDAIGGVIHFRTEQPEFVVRTILRESDLNRDEIPGTILRESDLNRDEIPGTQDAVKGTIAMSYTSAARATTLAAKLRYGAENWGGLTLLSNTSTGHLRAGAQRPDGFPNFGRRDAFVERQNGTDVLVANPDPNRQVRSGYDQINLLQKLRFRLRPQLELNANFQLSTSSDIPRYDNLIEERGGNLRWARWDYGPQTRTLTSFRLQDRRKTALYDLASYQLSHQFIAEDRIARRRNDPLEEHNLEDVQATNLQLDFIKALTPQFTLRYGLDGRYDWVDSKAFFRNVDTGEETPGLATRYPSAGSSLLSGGLYLEGQYQLAASWQLRGGFRLSRQRLFASFSAEGPVAWPQIYLDGISNVESAITTSIGLRQRAGWRFLYSQGFRAPNIDDFAKFRERNGFIQVPNPALRPERSHTLEAAYTFTNRRLFGRPFDAEVTAYHTWLEGAVARQAGILPSGSDFFVSRGDTLWVQTNVNATTARVWGFDLVLQYALTDYLQLKTDFHYLYGRRQQRAPDGRVFTLPQDHIPPAYGATSLRWGRRAWALGFRLRYQLAKDVADYAVGEISGSAATGYTFDRTGTSDNLELTPFLAEEGRFAGAYAWWTANLWAEWTLSSAWTFRLKADNLFDRHYRTFASGISAPGRDLGIGVTWVF